jgi:hypothetical protein
MSHLASYLRPAKGRRPPLKEKFVAIYEAVFDGSLGQKHPRRFWDELFLLRVNAPFLISCIRGVSEDQLFAVRASVSEVCGECVGYLHDGNLLRVSHALETLVLILQYVARKRFAERGLGVINVAAGGQANADAFFSQLLNGCATLMANHVLPVALRRLAVRLLLVVATGTDNVNQNALVGYFMLYPLYEPIMKVLVAPTAVPGGGTHSASGAGATALAHGAAGFGNEEPRGDTVTLDQFFTNGSGSADDGGSGGGAKDSESTGGGVGSSGGGDSNSGGVGNGGGVYYGGNGSGSGVRSTGEGNTTRAATTCTDTPPRSLPTPPSTAATGAAAAAGAGAARHNGGLLGTSEERERLR